MQIIYSTELFVVYTPECLREGAVLDLHTGKNDSVGRLSAAITDARIYSLVRGSEKDANSSTPLTLFGEPDLDYVIPIIIHLGLVVNII